MSGWRKQKDEERDVQRTNDTVGMTDIRAACSNKSRTFSEVGVAAVERSSRSTCSMVQEEADNAETDVRALLSVKSDKDIEVLKEEMKSQAALMEALVAGDDSAASTAEGEVAKVHLDNMYDYFNPANQRVEVHSMPDGVVHRRWAKSSDRRSTTNGLPIGTPSSSSMSPCMSVSSGAQSPCVSQDGGEEIMWTSQGIKPVLQRAVSKFNHEPVTNWGVLVAKVINTRVLNITAVIRKAVNKKRKTMVKDAGVVILTSVKQRASIVVNKARALSKKVGKESLDWFDNEWAQKGLLEYLLTSEYSDAFILIANGCRKVLSAQPVVAEVETPCKVFGDIHGQFRDVLLLFNAFGFPGDEKGPIFIFNGDFVDRGTHQLEVIGMLMALKIVFPTQVYLIRGNHEDKMMNERYGFKDECMTKLGRSGPKAYESMHKVFDELPLAAVISEQVLVVHGGIGDRKWNLDELRAVKKPVTGDKIMANPMIFNVLWSDPIEENDAGGQDDAFGVHASPRVGVNSVNFGWNVTKTFCARNGLSLVIRSHQSKQDSLGLDVMHDRMLMRVFSARDYEGHDNDAAILKVSRGNGDEHPIAVRLQVLSSVAKTRMAVETKLRWTKNERGDKESPTRAINDIGSDSSATSVLPRKTRQRATISAGSH